VVASISGGDIVYTFRATFILKVEAGHILKLQGMIYQNNIT
jgi:hypothetical protein